MARCSVCGSKECCGGEFERVANGVLCTGAVCPLITRGPNKGEPNFRKYDKSTKAKVLVPFRKEGIDHD